ncbi:MAG TPA: amidohydrolase family protein [Candidatus Angelobacter sp.]|jgi:N-acyl-D-aspartate/D-glutamate deacylase|nr:amidohydrolase family protein [Candidatus Angelobacter sp.]
MKLRIHYLAVILWPLLAWSQNYDLVIQGGRVLDPETGLDAVRNVGITQGKIRKISAETLAGRKIISAQGLVVAPGFIDLHQHGQDLESQRLKALDGVTTALELEIGKPDVASFLQSKEGHSLINYGTAASHVAARSIAFGTPIPTGGLLPKSGPATDQTASQEQVEKMKARLRHELDAGALAVGMGIQYTPGATRWEVIEMFRLAAERSVPVYTHVRSSGKQEPGSSIESVSEVIGAAAVSGAPLHIVHINSSCLSFAAECLTLIAGARVRGLDVTTEAYPYEAGMTYINSALFNPGWQEKVGISYHDLMLPETGERLTKERFEELHNSSEPHLTILFNNSMEVVDSIFRNPLVMVASDGDKGHPRNSGTFCRILARYVRSQGTLTLMDAIRKMSLMPAQVLERSTPSARFKGRLQEGADADVVVFDAQTISDRSTFQRPMEASVGVKYLLVGGVMLVDQEKFIEGVFPGKAVLGIGQHQ